MLKVDSVHIWPVSNQQHQQVQGWGEGVCFGTVVPIQRITAIKDHRAWFESLVTNVNKPMDPTTVTNQVEELFSDETDKASRKRSVEDMIQQAEEFQVESVKKIATAAAKTVVLAVEDTIYEKRVQTWFESFHKEGRAGNVGLVPEPVRAMYPARPPLALDQQIKAYVVHFAEWNEKH